MFYDGCRRYARWLARFLVLLRPGHTDFGTDAARQSEVYRLEVFIGRRNHRPGAFQLLLQFEWVALYRKIQVADGKTANDVAHRAAGEIDIHARGASNVLRSEERRVGKECRSRWSPYH